MIDSQQILFLLIILSAFYMAWNIGANDVANAMGTSVGSGALTLFRAVIVASVLEFSGAFFFGSHVSETIQSGIINVELFVSTPILLVYGMLAALIATGAWLQVASYFGWPVSTTHAIVGGIIGFGLIVGGIDGIYWENIFFILASWVLSPLFGGVFAYLIFSGLRKNILYTANPVASAKRMAPFLVFIVVGMLVLILIFQGLHNLNLHLSLAKGLAIGFGISLIGALIAKFILRNIEEATQTKAHPYSVEVYNELDKVKKQLQQVLTISRGETAYQVSALIEDIEFLRRSVKGAAERKEITPEYVRVEKIFSYLQVMSACLMAFAHGANDVANAIGPLSAAIHILKTGSITATTAVPAWALAWGGFGIVIGLATWGWRVIETIGRKLTELTPTRGFAAEFGAASTILIASRLGMPISTTHTLVGAVIGVALARGLEALDLSTTRDIFLSWVITIPASAIMTATIYYLILAVF